MRRPSSRTREPITTSTSGSCSSTSQKRGSSESGVARSASQKPTLVAPQPSAASIPCRTASALPRFCGRSRTTAPARQLAAQALQDLERAVAAAVVHEAEDEPPRARVVARGTRRRRDGRPRCSRARRAPRPPRTVSGGSARWSRDRSTTWNAATLVAGSDRVNRRRSTAVPRPETACRPEQRRACGWRRLRRRVRRGSSASRQRPALGRRSAGTGAISRPSGSASAAAYSASLKAPTSTSFPSSVVIMPSKKGVGRPRRDRAPGT